MWHVHKKRFLRKHLIFNDVSSRYRIKERVGWWQGTYMVSYHYDIQFYSLKKKIIIKNETDLSSRAALIFPQKETPSSSPHHQVLLQVSVLLHFLPSGSKERYSHSLMGRLRQHTPRKPLQSPAYLLFLLLLFLLGDLGGLVLPYQLGEVSHILICLL